MALAIVIVAFFVWPVIGSAHDVDANSGSHDLTVPFTVAIGLSVFLSVAIGLVTVARCRPNHAVSHVHEPTTRIEVTVLLIVLGLVAFLPALTQQWVLAVGSGMLGGAVAWFGRTHGVSPHSGCADMAFGAILGHRTVEGILIAGIYAANAALGILSLTLLTVHVMAETVAVGGLYAPISRGWGVASIVMLQLTFIVGVLLGGFFVGFLSATIVITLLSGVGGVLFITGVTEFRVVTRRQKRVKPNQTVLK